ncbi:MAG: ABC transporter substrate-binding protein [Rickettsiales bacterium]|nr:ABC transporter substrate-binding protein [Rickettsiales bacterium]
MTKARLLAFFALLFLPLPAFAPRALASDLPDPTAEATEKNETAKAKEAYAKKFANMVLAIIQDPKKDFGDRKTILRDAFSKSVDIDWIARFVLGNGWAHATDEQKEQYTKLYRRYLTETYVSNFAENPDKRIRDIKVYNVNEQNEQDFTVRTEMMLANMDNLRVNYLVNDTDGHYRVRDIAIENVSLINSHRSEFSRLASRLGVQGVIEELEKRLDGMRNREV